MARRYKKVRIIDLAAREIENKFRFPRSRRRDMATAAMGADEKLPLYSEDEKYMGDLVDGIYQCFELTDGVFVSHFTCDTYDQLKNHMFFVHT